MTKKSRKSEDAAQSAHRTVQTLIDKYDEPAAKPKKKNPAAVALGRLGGKKGGTARAKVLTPERRSEIARKAAEKRWGKKEK
jgi:hypothetical protein